MTPFQRVGLMETLIARIRTELLSRCKGLPGTLRSRSRIPAKRNQGNSRSMYKPGCCIAN